jgi:peptidoglycan/xylan/chitin deacetylase (PgdA/CDA1 family)
MVLHRLSSAVAALLLLASPVIAQDATPDATQAGTPQRSVNVTFDDLPFQASYDVLCDPAGVEAMTDDFVAMLKPLDTHAVAFVNEGLVCDEVRANVLPGVLKRWTDAGIELGNHTFSHIDANTATADAWLAEVDRGEIYTRPLVEAEGGELRWLRHPYLHAGDTQDKADAIAAGLTARKYIVAPVTLDNNDWMFAVVYRAAEAAGDAALMTRIGEAYVAHMVATLDHDEPYSAELNNGREPAQVLLLHANSLNRDWYPQIHALFLSRGYRFVPLETALADPIYARADTFVGEAGVSWLYRWAVTEGLAQRAGPQPPQWVRDDYVAIEAALASGD